MEAEEYLEEMDKSDNDINSIIEEAMIGFAKMKCKELLEIVAEKADKAHIGGWDLDRDEILNAVDLDSFCS